MRAVIFDFDAVLVNSAPLHFPALRDRLRPEGSGINGVAAHDLRARFGSRA